MYERQWFGADSQLGLSSLGQEVEYHIWEKNYHLALQKAIEASQQVNSTIARSYWSRQIRRILRLQTRQHSNTLYYDYTNFWPGFDKSNNEISNLLKLVSCELDLKFKLSTTKPDILFTSCFGNHDVNKLAHCSSTIILFIGENVRPSFTLCDYSLSHDTYSFCGRNIYLPLWLLRTQGFSCSGLGYDYIHDEMLTTPRAPNQKGRTVALISNNNTPHRLEAKKFLTDLGFTVDCFGSNTRPISSKLSTHSSYNFPLCLENSYYPGYVTEKLIDGFAGGTVPLYWGGLLQDVFYEDAYIDINRLYSLGKLGASDYLLQLSNRSSALLAQQTLTSFRNELISVLTKVIRHLFL